MNDQPASGRAHEITGAETRQEVRSPEQVILHLPIAGPTSRMLAYAIDYVIIFLALIGAVVLLLMTTSLWQWLDARLAPVFGRVAETHGRALRSDGTFLIVIAAFVLLQFVLEWGYFVVAETISGGRSLGKALLGLRVVRDGGLPISLRESLLRNLLRIVDVLPSNYVVGLVAMLVSPDGKRLGDLAAGTVVIRLDRPEPAAPLAEAESDAFGDFRFDHAQIARLGPNERALLRQTLRRLQTLAPDTAAGVLERAVEVLRERIGYGPVATAERERFLRALLGATRGR